MRFPLLLSQQTSFCNCNSLCNFLFPVPCSSCRTPRQDCIVCAAYHKVYGKDFLSYRFGHDDSQHRTTSAPLSEPPRRQLTPPEDEPPYESRAYSAPLPLSRRIFPRVRGEHYSGSYLSSDSTSDEIHERVDRIIRKHSPQPVRRVLVLDFGNI